MNRYPLITTLNPLFSISSRKFSGFFLRVLNIEIQPTPESPPGREAIFLFFFLLPSSEGIQGWVVKINNLTTSDKRSHPPSLFLFSRVFHPGSVC
jgi:hypothetical protein